VLFQIVFLSSFVSSMYQFKNNIKLGHYYSTQCKPIETNIDNGLFSANTNMIECNGVINNVNMDDYNTAVSAYQNSLNNEK
uniref:hypothetical protein n=1 Tax=Providencia alcalifaciens TaxID=126385 RepID=UPI002B05784C